MRKARSLAVLVVTAVVTQFPPPTATMAAPVVHLELIRQLPGRILDVAQDRILFIDESIVPERLMVEERPTGNQLIIGEGPVPHGFLSPGGAIYVHMPGSVTTARLIQVTDGMVIDLGVPNSVFSLAVAGRWAIWNTEVPSSAFPGERLIQRDLLTGQQRIVSDNAGNISNDVAENGDIAFWDRQYNIVRDRDGQQEIVSASTVDSWVTYPLTDGQNVIYRRTTPCCGGESGDIWLTTQDGEVSLDASRPAWPEPGQHYQVGGGWAAFTRSQPSGGYDVWTRNPAGLIEQRSAGIDAQLVALGDIGEVIFASKVTGVMPARELYLSRSGTEASFLGSPSGFAVMAWLLDGRWHVAIDDRLYLIAEGPTATPSPTPSPSPITGATKVPDTASVSIGGRFPVSVVFGLVLVALFTALAVGIVWSRRPPTRANHRRRYRGRDEDSA